MWCCWVHHDPETCPASRAWGTQLLAQVSASMAARHGVAIQAEAIIEGEHGLLLIVEAADHERVERFLDFLAGFGRVQVFPSSSAEEAVERGGCGLADRSPEGSTVDRPV